VQKPNELLAPAKSGVRLPEALALRLLVVEDDAATRRMLETFLQRIGCSVAAVESAQLALLAASDSDFDAAILDVMLPDTLGWTLIGQLRQLKSDLPILFLTARTSREDELRGLGLGADDFVRKPIDPAVLVARLKAVLSRSGRLGTRVFPGIRIDSSARTVEVDGDPVGLSRREFDLLAALAAQPTRVFTRGELLDRVWGSDYVGGERTVDTRINSLRRKLGDTGHQPRFIAAIRGVGYRFIAAQSTP